MEVYADNAATTKTSDVVIESMIPYMKQYYANPSSIHTMGQKSKEVLSQTREKIAKILNCDRGEIIFTSGGSESDTQAIMSVASIGEKLGKKHIISTKFEHHAVLNTLNKLKSRGFEISLLDVNKNGIINLEDLENAIREDTCLVTIMYANNEIGTIQPISHIGKICRKMGVLFHTDAVQAIGHLKIDVKQENIDMLSCSAHKFNGPKGIGFLYSKKGIQLANIINGGAQERGKRAGTENLPAIVGMGIALEDSIEHLDENNKYVLNLRNRLINGISKIPHSILNGDSQMRLVNNVNFSFEGIDGESLLLLLNEKGIYASAGSACSSGALDSSHVLLAIGREKRLANGSIRLTLSAENTLEEVDYIIENVTNIVEHLRKMSPVWSKLISGEEEFLTD